jgi:hypothetical protein
MPEPPAPRRTALKARGAGAASIAVAGAANASESASPGGRRRRRRPGTRATTSRRRRQASPVVRRRLRGDPVESGVLQSHSAPMDVTSDFDEVSVPRTVDGANVSVAIAVRSSTASAPTARCAATSPGAPRGSSIAARLRDGPGPQAASSSATVSESSSAGSTARTSWPLTNSGSESSV